MIDACICGHGKEAHMMAMRPACAILIHKRKELLADRCPCEEYKLDNLRYLEVMAFRNGY